MQHREKEDRTVDGKCLVSIGMPVYNEERYIEQALQSLLSQSVEDFELIISDNASTDRTGRSVSLMRRRTSACATIGWKLISDLLQTSVVSFNCLMHLISFGPQDTISGMRPS